MNRASFSERASGIQSPVHRLGTGEKLVLGIGLIVFIVALPRGWAAGLGLATAVLLLGVYMSRIPWGEIGRVLLRLEPLALGVSLVAGLGAAGLSGGLFLAAKCNLCILTALLLSGTTPFPELVRAMRRARFPSLLVTTLALMYRYRRVLIDEAERMRRARAARTMTRRRWHVWRMSSGVIGRLFVRASERAERLYGAMLARGWK